MHLDRLIPRCAAGVFPFDTKTTKGTKTTKHDPSLMRQRLLRFGALVVFVIFVVFVFDSSSRCYRAKCDLKGRGVYGCFARHAFNAESVRSTCSEGSRLE